MRKFYSRQGVTLQLPATIKQEQRVPKLVCFPRDKRICASISAIVMVVVIEDAVTFR